ncbi:MAG: hypothetical protein A3G18_02670 [Rhodospirillales bacterium RIFCSPLOWO2_12_FULL_58_28]|nr:MAG: hypothetical protein A3H92_09940 [Rhodospirillales bacterium RIFCSPLOWO2_02_FULL_58_16]OHC79462.1 MAG: hypothetical protein A3G18_02670 [Rhodospirillales bacterium RIFCSPLOWO2_12_FULL_58_28]
MLKNSFKLDYMKLGIIAFALWTACLATVFYVSLGPYSAPTAEEMRTPDLVEALAPTFAFQCYAGDEGKVGSDPECENKILSDRDAMIFLIDKTRIFMFFYFTVPIALWIFFMAFPKAFNPIRRLAE